jgi:hypothetical protein
MKEWQSATNQAAGEIVGEPLHDYDIASGDDPHACG